MKRLSILLAVLAAGVALAQASAPAPATPSNAWPRVIGVENGSVEIFQPQIESFRGDQLAARAAVAWTPTGRPPAFGVVWVEARVSIDKVAGDVGLQDVKVQRVRFANMSKEQEQQGRALLEREIPTWDLHLSVLELEASIAVNEQEIQSSEALDFTPPRMVFSQEPAVLVVFDGAPIERPVESTELRRVVNTPMLVLFDPATRSYYLSGGKFWYAAPAATGPFAPVAAPSPAVSAFFARNPPPPIELEGNPEEQAAEKAVLEPSAPPRIVVATEPTELFVFDGAPQYRPVGEEAYLLYVANTESHVLVDVQSGETYVLASGRWFRAPSLDGPWVNVPPDELPGPFGDIPPDSDIGDVRTFVAGTEEAADAVADSLIPQTAEVRRDQQFQAAYDGPPQFQRIEGTELSYAVNTPDAVVLDAGRYWACDQGVWYTAPAAEGPFVVADQRPPHIDQVPPTVHIYNTRYVFVYRSTPQVVFVGHTPGFVGVYRHRGVVVFGTGFVYRPWIGPTVFFARPTTFGVRVVYNPWTGFGFVVSPATPFITVGIHFHPAWGPRPRPPGWWGPVVYRPVFIVPPSRHGWHRPPPGFRPPPLRFVVRRPAPGPRPSPARLRRPRGPRHRWPGRRRPEPVLAPRRASALEATSTTRPRTARATPSARWRRPHGRCRNRWTGPTTSSATGPATCTARPTGATGNGTPGRDGSRSVPRSARPATRIAPRPLPHRERGSGHRSRARARRPDRPLASRPVSRQASRADSRPARRHPRGRTGAGRHRPALARMQRPASEARRSRRDPHPSKRDLHPSNSRRGPRRQALRRAASGADLRLRAGNTREEGRPPPGGRPRNGFRATRSGIRARPGAAARRSSSR